MVQRDFELNELFSTIVSLEARYGMCVLPESMARMHSCKIHRSPSTPDREQQHYVHVSQPNHKGP